MKKTWLNPLLGDARVLAEPEKPLGRIWAIVGTLVILILFLIVLANAVDETKVYSSEEIKTLENEGQKVIKTISYTNQKLISARAVVGKPVVIEGAVWVSMRSEESFYIWNRNGRVSNDGIHFSIYKDDLEIASNPIRSNDSGFYKFDKFVPRDSGYHRLTIRVFYGGEWHPSDINGERHHPGDIVFYVSPIPDSDGDGWNDEQEKKAETDPYNVDTDGDGIWDPKDPNPLVASTPTITPTATISGLQIIPINVALLAAAYLFRMRK